MLSCNTSIGDLWLSRNKAWVLAVPFKSFARFIVPHWWWTGAFDYLQGPVALPQSELKTEQSNRKLWGAKSLFSYTDKHRDWANGLRWSSRLWSVNSGRNPVTHRSLAQRVEDIVRTASSLRWTHSKILPHWHGLHCDGSRSDRPLKHLTHRCRDCPSCKD